MESCSSQKSVEQSKIMLKKKKSKFLHEEVRMATASTSTAQLAHHRPAPPRHGEHLIMSPPTDLSAIDEPPTQPTIPIPY